MFTKYCESLGNILFDRHTSFFSVKARLFRESSSFPEITEWRRLHSKVEIRLLNIMSLVGRSDYFFSIRLVFVFFHCAHNQNKLCNSMMYIFKFV